MKSFLSKLIAVALLIILQTSIVQAQTIPSLSTWVSTTSPVVAITQQIWGRALKITGLQDGCLFLVNSILTSSGSLCGAGGGGGGAGTFSTTTVAGKILQYPYTSLVTSLNTNATTTSRWWYDPVTSNQWINASTTIGGQLTVSNIIATSTTASTFPYASTTALTVSGTSYLGTVGSGTLTGATGLPISTGVSGLGTGVATFLATPSSANLISAVTNETGTGALVFATSPTLVTPVLGTPTSVTLTNGTGLPLTTGVTGTLPVANGGTGRTSFTGGQLLYGNGTGSIDSVATTTVTCAGTVSCSTFTTIGSSPITLTGSGGGSGTYPFTPATNFNVNNQATTGIAWFQNGLNASSTSHFDYASTTALTVSGTLYPNQVNLSADGAASTPVISWASDPNTGIYRGGADILGLSANGASVFWNSLAFYPATDATRDLGRSSNTWKNFYTTYASTTALSATTLCLSTDCRSAWPLGLAYPFTPATNYNTNNQATTGIAWFQNGLNASSTSHFDYASTTALSAQGNIYVNGNLAVGTTTPGSLLSIGNTTGINFTTGTSTFNTTAGINIKAGCFAINGVCISGGGGGGSGTVTTLTAGTNITFSSGATCTTTCTINATGGSGSFPFTTGTFGATTANATSTLIGFTNGLYTTASSTFTATTTLSRNTLHTLENIIATSTTMNIDWGKGNKQTVRISTSAITLTFSNPTLGDTLSLLVCNQSTGTAGTITWPSLISWPGGVQPGQTTTANQCDMWSFNYMSGTSTPKYFLAGLISAYQ